MKNVIMILVLGMTFGISVYADIATTVTKVTAEQFEARFNEVLYGGSFEGEVEDLGGNCEITMSKNTKNKTIVTMSMENGMKFSLDLDQNQTVTIKEDSDGEDFFTEYKSQYFTITHMHASDAYDTLTLSNGITKLQCGSYY